MALVVLPRSPLDHWKRTHRRRAELGFPPVWWAAIKVVVMVAFITAVLAALPLLAIRFGMHAAD